MIQNDHQLSMTLEALAGFYRALAELKRDRSLYHPSWYVTLAEGPLEQIQRLEAEVNAYVGRVDAEAATADLWVHIEGDGVHWPDGPSSILSRSLQATRKAVQSVAEFWYSGRIGKKPSAIVARACDLGVSTIRAGSLQFGLELPKGADDLHVHEALKKLVQVASWVSQEHPAHELEEEVEDFELRAVALAGLVELAPSERDRVRYVQLSGRVLGGRTLSLDARAHQRAQRSLSQAMHEEPARYLGTVRESDLDARTFTLRQLEEGGELLCRFLPELHDAVAAAMNRRVVVRGMLRTTISGRRVKRMQVNGIDEIAHVSAPDLGRTR